MNKKLFLLGLIFLIIFVVLAGCDETPNKTATQTSTQEQPKLFKLNQPQQGQYWQYTPSKVERASVLKNEYDSKQAGAGQEFLKLFITVKNVSNETQTVDFTFDPQPVILSGEQQYKNDWQDSIYLKESERLPESEQLAPGISASGYLLFKIPSGKTGLKLKIEDFEWDLGI